MNWITPSELHELMVEDGDIDPDEVSVSRMERLMNEMVEEGVMRRSGNLYQLANIAEAERFLRENDAL